MALIKYLHSSDLLCIMEGCFVPLLFLCLAALLHGSVEYFIMIFLTNIFMSIQYLTYL